MKKDIVVNSDLRKFNYLMGEIELRYHYLNLKLGLSDSYMKVLYSIFHYGGKASIKNICTLSGLPKQTVNSALRKMESEKIIFVETINSKNKLANLTEYGIKYAEKTVEVLIDIEDKIFSSWDKDELALYIRLTEKYLNQFEEMIENV